MPVELHGDSIVMRVTQLAVVASARLALVLARTPTLSDPSGDAPDGVTYPTFPTCTPVAGPLSVPRYVPDSAPLPAPHLWSTTPCPASLDDGTMVCLTAENNTKLCLPPGTYDLGQPYIYGFPYQKVVSLSLPVGARATFAVNGDRKVFTQPQNGSAEFSKVIASTASPLFANHANLTIEAPIDPPVACLFALAGKRGAYRCFGLGATTLPDEMRGQVAVFDLHGGVVAVGYGQAEKIRVSFMKIITDPINLARVMDVSDMDLTEIQVELRAANGSCPSGYAVDVNHVYP